MDSSLLDTDWIWHPDWVDYGQGTAGGFVHFRKALQLDHVPSGPLVIQITADTKYKLYINHQNVHSGPVKGDEHMWFYDELDIQPFLKTGVNHIGIKVLRFFHASAHATSFPRMPIPGLFVRTPDKEARAKFGIQSDDSWETSLDTSLILRVDQDEDDFLHVYEKTNPDPGISSTSTLQWIRAVCLELPKSHGISPPWVLTPRMIPVAKVSPLSFQEIHNIQSSIPLSAWEDCLLNKDNRAPLVFPRGSVHHVELELPHHATAWPTFRFKRPDLPGSRLTVTYSEAYEDEPLSTPYARSKGDRRDTNKLLTGPQDEYYTSQAREEETFAPFHFRTLRFMALYILVSDQCPLELIGVELDMTHYPLDVLGGFSIPGAPEHDTYYQKMWRISVRTLTNCMHDCYEDCPFYEQLQYAMDVRSSCLFTYAAAGDDRMARQAIVQLHNSYRPGVGLIASRSPSHQLQIIPHFSLFWICTVADHFQHYADAGFTRRFLAACDGILETFARRIDSNLDLVSASQEALGTHWDFVDWTNEWRPMGIPPAAKRTGFQTYTNMIYAYTLRAAASVVGKTGRPAVASEYESRADAVIEAVRARCQVDTLFTDGLASSADLAEDFSQHNQIWAVLSGAVTGGAAHDLLVRSLPAARDMGLMPSRSVQDDTQHPKLTEPSMAMSFYMFRALSAVGGRLYDDLFHSLWGPWKAQISQNLTTWCEDDVTRRSDCHAWSCAPLYEFMFEVAGIYPGEAGWAVIAFKPRLSLFRDFECRVPLGGRLAPGVAHVSWKRGRDESTTLISVELQGVSEKAVPIRVELPNGQREEYVGPVVSLRV
ncbi:Six-hairpin glycosidase-like protein [Emericellopsis atlantica]|uniref:Six-hairpin glycosidase-like protein n=1 Tax=Emericellopsis atlantica TaxID=2614577 RepID=A0A9P8CMF4_9HYPO|nr:Six-hairpin glycosidase-like protein [Emericellopsis atlantica]KAG9252388.1 Six-hairpin glycosidase-like protein [Emericellopsis atlantica]